MGEVVRQQAARQQPPALQVLQLLQVLRTSMIILTMRTLMATVLPIRKSGVRKTRNKRKKCTIASERRRMMLVAQVDLLAVSSRKRMLAPSIKQTRRKERRTARRERRTARRVRK